MFKGQYFRNRRTGERVKIVEVINVQTRDGLDETYRLQDSGKASLTEAQINARYDKIAACEPVQEQA